LTLQPDEGRRRLQLSVFALSLRAFLSMFVNGMAMVLFPLYFLGLGYSVAWTGLLVAASGIGSIAVSLCVGLAIERADRRRALLAGSVLLALVYIGFVFVRSGVAITGLRLLQGMVLPLASVAGLTLMADIGGSARGRVAGAMNQWGSLGMLAGPAVGGTVMQFLGTGGAFWLSGLCILAGGVVVFLVVPASSGRSTPGTAPATRAAGRPTGRLLLLAGVNTIDFIAFNAWVLLLAVTLQSRGAPESLFGILLTVQTLAYAVVQRVCGRAADAGRGLPLVAACSLVYGVAVYALALWSSVWVMTALMVIIGLAAAPTFAAVFVEMTSEAGEATSRAMGLMNASTNLGNSLGPLAAGALGSLSLGLGFACTLGLCWLNAALAAGCVALRRRRAVVDQPAHGPSDA